MQRSEDTDYKPREQVLSQLETNLAQYDSEANDSYPPLSEIVTNPWLKQYILWGYAAKGVIYFVIGILAIEAAILPEKRAAGTYNALKHLSVQPLGSTILCLLAVGISGYVVRRLLQATIYPGHGGAITWGGSLQRTGYLISSLSYGGVAYTAISIVFGLGKYNNRIQDWVERLLEHAAVGEAIVCLGGIGVTGVGIGYLYGAYTGSYVSKFASDDIGDRLEYWARWLGKIGIAARGISFVVTGICLILASLWSDSHLAGGLQKAFRILAEQPLGWLWLDLIGGGFIAYGIYMFITARYRRYAIR